MDSEIKCLCSWNEASGSRQAIYVPGKCLQISGSMEHLSLVSSQLRLTAIPKGTQVDQEKWALSPQPTSL